ncbi:MAG: GlxA family transcriptional regulator [Gammaproteobacteria bacterium]|nr:GlxA family transcriptional regulator [Gammaproteobacteria bacterium]MXW51803.1 GlxA family transcriptional regulator [Gammaproteobacteria bacterium]MYE51906.1 GlxA family transcriptional regulator [Gammaproteobacteria bacterium]MYE85099.1 GlxA family transcriptional regulator [Gammaproteobacteria bacterium]MYF49967.1 GlxA family transcriptional regulator [Gammaproteobacteria bacterium]
MAPLDAPNQPLHAGFLLLPRYTLMSLSCAVSVLRMANRLSGQPLYSWSLHSVDGEPVESSDGLRLAIDGKLDETVRAKMLFACGGIEVEKACDSEVLHVLRAVAKRGIPLGALCTGSYALAAAGLLNGRRCAIHWENIASLRETFPQVLVQPSLFVIDRNRYTCSGGISSLDLMLNLVEAHHGRRLARDISEQFICERIRDQQDSQRIPLHHYLGASQPRVVEAVALMESNVEEPLSMEDLAAYVGVSRRQLERLFHKHLDCTPSRHYLELRLQRARLLLLQTDMPVIDIATSCGFSSAPHFSKCYQELFGRSPREERRQSGLHGRPLEPVVVRG